MDFLKLLKNKGMTLAVTGLMVFFFTTVPVRPGYSMSTVKTWVNKVRPGTFPELEAGKKEAPKEGQAEVADKSYTDTERRLLLSLMERKRQLDNRETDLNRQEEHLRALRDNIQHQLAELKKTQEQIEASIEAKKALDAENLKKVVNLYNTMDPKKAAQKFAGIDTKVAVKILLEMNQRKASAVLAELPPDKAKELTEEIVRKAPSPS